MALVHPQFGMGSLFGSDIATVGSVPIGPGTYYPVATTWEQMMRLYWAVTSLGISISINSSYSYIVTGVPDVSYAQTISGSLSPNQPFGVSSNIPPSRLFGWGQGLGTSNQIGLTNLFMSPIPAERMTGASVASTGVNFNALNATGTYTIFGHADPDPPGTYPFSTGLISASIQIFQGIGIGVGPPPVFAFIKSGNDYYPKIILVCSVGGTGIILPSGGLYFLQGISFASAAFGTYLPRVSTIVATIYGISIPLYVTDYNSYPPVIPPTLQSQSESGSFIITASS